MRTLLIVGSSPTRVVRRGDRDVVFTPRRYPALSPRRAGPDERPGLRTASDDASGVGSRAGHRGLHRVTARPRRQRRPADHEHRHALLPGRGQLRRRQRAAAVLGDQHVDAGARASAPAPPRP